MPSQADADMCAPPPINRRSNKKEKKAAGRTHQAKRLLKLEQKRKHFPTGKCVASGKSCGISEGSASGKHFADHQPL